MKSIRQVKSIGLQEGDSCRLITDCGQRIYVKATKTRNGYVRLEVEAPEQFAVDKLPLRENRPS